MITDEQVQQALDRLNAPSEAAHAHGRRVKAEHMLKVIKSLQMKKHDGLSVAAQEREALSSSPYYDQLDEVVKASIDDLLYRSKMEADKATIEVYRTQQANQRYNL
mgnify:FL=1|jgi:hypothetical protein